MKHSILTSCLCISALFTQAQSSSVVKEINNEIARPLALAPLRFLASDELMGRGTMRPEINIAARYISEAFRSMGVKEVPGTSDYFQPFSITMKKAANEGSFTTAGKTFDINTSLLIKNGGDTVITAPVLYARHATANDLKNIDVKGKIIITEPGDNDAASFMQGFDMLNDKRKMLQEKGAVALIERFKEGSFPWNGLQQYLSREHATVDNEHGMPVLIINDNGALKNISGTNEGTLTLRGTQTRIIPAKNVIGWVEGSDAKLKNQYIVLSAHYDHLGVAKQPKMEDGKMDSIYNGARDNAIGVTAVLDAAKYFAQHPPKRSVLFIAYAAEEIGEVGSKYFSAHPALPLKQLVYNLNIDNASYNDTSIVTVVGLGRTSADNDIIKACAAFGLKALPDPAPEQNLFDRSDNVNLAIHGVPAPTFSLGIKKFDAEINQRYHQLSDEVDNFNLDYAIKYIRSFILSAKSIADNPQQPKWIKGDKYEAAWQQLYKQE